MVGRRVAKAVKFLLFAVLFVAVCGYVVMSLWNWLAPTLFGLHVITFWQALGLLILCKILFGGFRGKGGRGWSKRGMERWRNMTPEEREKVRKAFSGECGPFAAPPDATKA
jgi:hypothetical protein